MRGARPQAVNRRGLVQMIPGHPGHPSRDSGTERADRGNVGLTLGLDTARTRSAGQPELQELLGKLKAETQRAVTDVRRIVYGLRPPALDELGLVGSLREEVRRLQLETRP